MTDPTRSEVPTDRLTRICDAMTRTFDEHPEHHAGDKCIVFLDDGTHGGIVINGYDDDTDALADLLQHLRAIFAANGTRMDLMFMDEDGATRA